MSRGQANAEQLLTLTERLTAAMTADAQAFEARRPMDAAARIQETSHLANIYRHESSRIKAEPSLLEGASPDTRRRLTQATEAFEAVLARHARALRAAKTVTEGVVKAIAEEVGRTRTASAGYGPGAQTRAVQAAPIALNRRA